jgi:hypothetical protein
VVRQSAAAGLKPSAGSTKAGTQRVPGGLFAKPCITPTVFGDTLSRTIYDAVNTAFRALITLARQTVKTPAE